MRYYQEMTLLPNPEVNIHFLWSKAMQQIHLGLVEMQNVDLHIPMGLSFPRYVLNEKGGYIGDRCRLFAPDESVLAQFDAVKWLSRLSDYVHCTGIRTVPEKLTGYSTYKRVQPKTNPQRLARRYAKRHNLDLDTALNGMVKLRGEGDAVELVPPPDGGRLGGGRSKGSEVVDLASPNPNPHPLGEEAVLLNSTATGGGGTVHPTAFRYCDMPKTELGLPYIRLKSLSGGQSFCLWIEKTTAVQPVAGGFSCYGLSATATVPEF
jgi:CRISPR-associated endonuclease Csy4